MARDGDEPIAAAMHEGVSPHYESGEESDRSAGWDDWGESESDGDGVGDNDGLICLFCSSGRFDSADSLFLHCDVEHKFDFRGIERELRLDFYGSIKLINYVRSQVAKNECWCCGEAFKCNGDLLSHLHKAENYMSGGIYPWGDDSYLKPYMENDSLLHSLSFGDEDDEDSAVLDNVHNEDDTTVSNGDKNVGDALEVEPGLCDTVGGFEESMINGSIYPRQSDRQLKVTRAGVNARKMRDINDNYFGSYSSFGIHREMLSDSVRTNAYRDALLNNPSLMDGATVLDVGCGTGILSLFAARAGASRVIAVEASAKMAAVATQIAKDNGLLASEDQTNGQEHRRRVIQVVNSVVEDLDKQIQIPEGGFDVLVSEWMGYCLLYESMLDSVLNARDRFLKPGGAILPNTATILGAGFGRGGTSLPFWEDVYGFNMSCIGKEIDEEAARLPIVDVIDARDIVTNTAAIHNFDLATMQPDDVDFTASFELTQKADATLPGTVLCHGIVLWFETGFTERFCKEKPVALSTSPFLPKTHWSQTIITFRGPIALKMDEAVDVHGSDQSVGNLDCPAKRIQARISIARALEHRSIDVSVEVTAVNHGGKKRRWPAQLFSL